MRVLQKLTVEKYGKVRFGKDFVFQKRYDDGFLRNKRVLFLDAPEYGNLGDQAIAYATIRFCSRIFGEGSVLEIPESEVISHLTWLKKKLDPDGLIVLQGGGSMGNLYPKYEFVRRTIIRNFPNNRIVVFPQTIAYTDDTKGKKDAEDAYKVYGKHPNITLFARESESYTLMRKLFPTTDVRLCPDIALSLVDWVTNDGKRENIGVCIRNDKERRVGKEIVKKTINSIRTERDAVKPFDTSAHSDAKISGETRERILRSRLQEISSYRIVLTDRMHGMIFAYITSTPCIAFPSLTGKIEHTYLDWLKNSENISFVKEREDAIKMPMQTKSAKLNFDALYEALTK